MASIRVIIAVDDVSDVLESYNQIQVYRSMDGIGGTYNEITASEPSAASVSGTNDAPFTLNGETLSVRIDDGAVQDVTVEEEDPVFIDPLLTELLGKITDATLSNGGTGNLKIESTFTGTQSIVEITGGTGLTELGLTVGKVTGQDRRVTLQDGYDEYTFIDSGGDTTYYYKVRFYNSYTGQTSDFSDPIPGAQVSPIAAELVTASLDLVGLDGEPLADRLITISNVFDPDALVVSSHGVLGRAVTFSTDASGHGEISLVIGTVVDVSISGTGLTRRITVPDTDFDLTAAVAAADDIFQIQTPSFPDAIRRS